MKGWTNTRPEESGYYWVVKKYFEDGELKHTTEPDVWYINPDSKYGCCSQLGTDYPDEIPDGEARHTLPEGQNGAAGHH